MDMDMTWAPGRASYIELGPLPEPLVVAGRLDTTSAHPAHTALERCRSMGNPRLDAAQTPGHWQAARNSRVCEGVSLTTFGPLDVGFLVSTRDRIMPFAFCSHGSFEATIAALRGLVPTFEAIARVPWYLVEGTPSPVLWAHHALAPPWLNVRQTSHAAEDRTQEILAGLAIAHGITSGRVQLVGGRFGTHGRFIPPRFGHQPTGWPDVDGDIPMAPGFNPRKLWPGPFPFLRQVSFASGIVDHLNVEHLAGLSSHARMACVHAFLSVLDSPETAHDEVAP